MKITPEKRYHFYGFTCTKHINASFLSVSAKTKLQIEENSISAKEETL